MAKTDAETIYVLNGPNLNVLGTREPETYGHASLADVEKLCADTSAQFGLKVDCRQSNREGELKGLNLFVAGCIEAVGTIVTSLAEAQTVLEGWR